MDPITFQQPTSGDEVASTRISSTAHTSTTIAPSEQVASTRTAFAPDDDGASDDDDTGGDGQDTPRENHTFYKLQRAVNRNDS